jgi:hypothetical protein
VRPENFDFTRQVVPPAEPSETWVPADTRLLPIYGGFRLSGRSSGTWLVVLPQQFSSAYVRAMSGDGSCAPISC